jgi:peptidoglycan/LPS O-acetylase OafA/YrhL
MGLNGTSLLAGLSIGLAVGGLVYLAMVAFRVPDTRPSRSTGSSTYRRLGRVPALDGLRGVAIFLVLLVHTELLFLPKWTTWHKGFGILGGGALGVDLFFVLSGFLITALLLREQTTSDGVRFGTFYRNRALRLFPALFVMVACVVVFSWLTHEAMRAELVTAAYGIFYVANWQTTWSTHDVALNLSHLWSLSVEEQFYLIWPAVLVLCFGLRRDVKLLTGLIVGLIVAIAVRRLWLWEANYPSSELYTHLDTRADALLIGALLACLWVRRLTPTRGLPALGWISSGVFVACVALGRAAGSGYFKPTTGFLFEGGFTLAALAAAGVILAVLDGRWIGTVALEARPLRALGRISYGLYLWHIPVFFEVAPRTTSWPVVPRIVLAWGLSLGLTIASWRLVEVKFLRMKRGNIAPAPPAAAEEPSQLQER